MEGWSSLVRCGSPYRTARVHGDTPYALAKVPRVPPPHIHIRREGCPPADGYRRGLVVGFFEELGWTGFAIPTLLRQRYGVLSTGLIVGVLWGAWHLLVAFWSSGSASGEPALVSFLLDAFLFLVAFRVLMVWVYERTNGSLLVAILMHMSLVATVQMINPFGPLKMAGVSLLTFDLLWAALCAILAAVAVAQGGHLSRQPPIQGRVA